MSLKVTRMAKAAYRLPRVPEKVEQAHIVQLLRTLGADVWVTGTRRPRGDYAGTCMTPGLPDLVVLVRTRAASGPSHRLVFIECKGDGGRLRPEQVRFRDLCRAAGVAHVVGGLDAVIAWLVETGLAKAENFPSYRQPQEIV